MKTKKAVIFESLQGLIIFAIILVAVILLVRKFSSEDGVNETKILQEIQQELTELAKQEGTLTHTLELDMNSAIIGYAKDKDAITLNFELNLPEKMGRPQFTATKFPENNDKAMTEIINLFEIQGLIKQRPNTCPTNTNCLCYCENIQTETNPESQYNTDNAYITCAEEQCAVIDQDINNEIYLNEFFKETDIKYSPLKNKENQPSTMQPQPETNSLHWDGGFIIMRTTKNIGTTCEAYGKYNEDIKNCQEIYTHRIQQKNEVSDVLIIKPTIAGYRKDFTLRYIDVEFKNEQGTITPRLI